jgi:preprotein translocase subunit SecY
MLELSHKGALSTGSVLVLLLVAIALVAVTVHLELARRRLELTFAARQVGTHAIQVRSCLRLKLNNAGIVPTILATWLVLLPIMAAGAGFELPGWIAGQLVQGRPLFQAVYGVAIVLCVFFYTAFVLSPNDIAEDLRKHGGAIPGIEPGEATAAHIDRVVSRLTAMGAVYLALVCLIPELLIAAWAVPVYRGGTSLLIVVCAILDLKAQFDQKWPEGVEAT